MDKKQPGIFITLEGGEGAGKTTQASVINKFFQKNNRETLEIKEPGITLVGNKVREIIRETTKPISAMSELLLFSAARIELIENIILPALKENKVVICDRFIDSTLAYQHYGRKIPLETVEQIIGLSTQSMKPDITILLDIDYNLAMQRKTEDLDYLEKESKLFHKNIRDGYKKLAMKEPGRWIQINAMQNKKDVSEEIISKIKNWIKNEYKN